MSITIQTSELAAIKVLLNKGKWSEAEGLLSHHLLSHQLDAQLHDLIGYALQRQGKWDEAEIALRRALELGTTSFWTWHRLGDIYRATRRLDLAIDAYQQALGVGSTSPTTMANLLKTLHARDPARMLRFLNSQPLGDLLRLGCLEAVGDTYNDFASPLLGSWMVNRGWIAPGGKGSGTVQCDPQYRTGWGSDAHQLHLDLTDATEAEAGDQRLEIGLRLAVPDQGKKGSLVMHVLVELAKGFKLQGVKIQGNCRFISKHRLSDLNMEILTLHRGHSMAAAPEIELKLNLSIPSNAQLQRSAWHGRVHSVPRAQAQLQQPSSGGESMDAWFKKMIPTSGGSLPKVRHGLLAAHLWMLEHHSALVDWLRPQSAAGQEGFVCFWDRPDSLTPALRHNFAVIESDFPHSVLLHEPQLGELLAGEGLAAFPRVRQLLNNSKETHPALSSDLLRLALTYQTQAYLDLDVCIDPFFTRFARALLPYCRSSGINMIAFIKDGAYNWAHPASNLVAYPNNDLLWLQWRLREQLLGALEDTLTRKNYINSIWDLSGPGLLRRVVFAEGAAAMEFEGLWKFHPELALPTWINAQGERFLFIDKELFSCHGLADEQKYLHSSQNWRSFTHDRLQVLIAGLA